jgi:hypothetical protein
MKKQRSSKTWLVKIEGRDEELKLIGVSSEGEAIAKAVELGHVALSARPMRKFKAVVQDVAMEKIDDKGVVTSVPLEADPAPVTEAGE